MLDTEPTGSAADPTAGDQGGGSAAQPTGTTADETNATTSRRRTSTRASRSGEPTATGAALDQQSGAADPEDASAPKARKTRARRAKDAAAPEGAEPPAAPAGVAPLFLAPEAPPAPEAKAAAPEAKAAAPEAKAAAPEMGAPETGAGEETPRRRRSRRATARAGDTRTDEAAAAGGDTAGAAETDTTDDAGQEEPGTGSRSRRRGRRGRGRGKGAQDAAADAGDADADAGAEAVAEAVTEELVAPPDEGEELAPGGELSETVKRRRRRRRRKDGAEEEPAVDDGVTVVRVREPRGTGDEVRGVTGSTRLEAKRQRRRGGREQRRTRPPVLSESEFLARREAVDRVMVIRESAGRTQIGVLEDGILVEHYVSRTTGATLAGSVYLGKVQNVLPSMEAAFVDVGRGRNAVLYAGEVNWDVAGLAGKARSIEQALKSGDSVMVQVTKDPVGHKGARLTSHIALSGRHLVYVPNGNASGISRKLPDNERRRLREALKSLVPEGAGVIIRTAAEGASEEELARDVKRLQAQWDDIQAKAARGNAPSLLYSEPDLVVRVVRDLFNEDFRELVIQGDGAYETVEAYLEHVSPDLVGRLRRHGGGADVFADYRVDEQILKGLDRKVYLPSGGHLVIDRTEAMTVIDVNTGKYTGTGGNLEETVTRNNLEAAEEIVRQLRLRDIGGIIVIDFIDMVLESNRDLVLRRLTECLGRDRTKHQVTEITSLGLVQMTRKRVGAGLLEAFSEPCECCKGRGVVVHLDPPPDKPRTRDAAEKVKAVASASTGNNGPRRRVAKRAAGPPEPIAAPEPAAPAATGGEPGAEADEAGEAGGVPPGPTGPAGGTELRLSDEGLGGVLRRFRRGGGRRRSRS